MKKIAVEPALTNVKDYLEDNNYKVDVLEGRLKDSRWALNRYEAIVVTGADQDLMGIQETLTKTQIVNAKGKSPEDVYNEIQSRTQ